MTVYVTQKQIRYDQETGSYVMRFPTIEKASSFGRLVYILQPTDALKNTKLVLSKLHHALSKFDDEDHLLLVGSPIIMGLATSIAAHHNNGRVRFLEWDQRTVTYNEHSIETY